jgi:hypothetical protein
VPLSEIPLGKVVSINGKKLIKVGENLYMAVAPVNCGSGYYLTDETCQTCVSKTANCAACNANSGACTACESGYVVSGDQCADSATTLQSFTKADCDSAAVGVIGTYSSNGTGSYVIRKLADGHCYINMNVKKQWYGSNSATGACNTAYASFPACHACYAINNNNDWFLPTLAQYDALIAAAGNGDQLYKSLGLSLATHFWSSSEYLSTPIGALVLIIEETYSSTNGYNSKSSQLDILCRRN